jgi:hypothetical protein
LDSMKPICIYHILWSGKEMQNNIIR